MLDVEIAKRRGTLELDVAFDAPAGTTVLVGESGAGKTTILRLLAGLESPDRGRIAVDHSVYFDSSARTSLPPWARDVGYLAQDYALFPHLTVFQNVAFGLKSAGVRARAVAPRVEEALRLTGIPDLASRLPTQLSGGQQQRAALARALVLHPRVLLLDEPLSALDLATRRVLRGELRALLRRLPCVTVYVTHSPVEALVFGEQIIVLEGGRVAQAGSREELLQHPRSAFVAELMGTNLFLASREDSGSSAPRIRTAEGDLEIRGRSAGGSVFLTVSPREVTLHREPPHSSAQNVFAGPIMELVPEPPAGERIRVVLGTNPMLVAEVTREAVAALALREGLPVYASFKATGVNLYS